MWNESHVALKWSDLETKLRKVRLTGRTAFPRHCDRRWSEEIISPIIRLPLCVSRPLFSPTCLGEDIILNILFCLNFVTFTNQRDNIFQAGDLLMEKVLGYRKRLGFTCWINDLKTSLKGCACLVNKSLIFSISFVGLQVFCILRH